MSALQVPERFNRNSPNVVSLMPPEQSGRWLLERMQRHLGIRDYATQSLLDFGCGVRFTQALLNLGLPLAQYVGVDCDRDMIEFLAAEVKDPLVPSGLRRRPGGGGSAEVRGSGGASLPKRARSARSGSLARGVRRAASTSAGSGPFSISY